MKGHKLHVRRKLKEIMENEENIGLINKNDFEDQLVPVFSSFLELFHYSISLSLILLDT